MYQLSKEADLKNSGPNSPIIYASKCLEAKDVFIIDCIRFLRIPECGLKDAILMVFEDVKLTLMLEDEWRLFQLSLPAPIMNYT